MSNSSKIKKVAKKLLELSLDDQGRVGEEKAKAVLDSLRENPPADHRTLLREFLFQVRRYLPNYQCELETANNTQSDLNSVLTEKVNASKEADYTLDASLNKALIAGYKLRIGDDVYEDSIHQRLENLRRKLS